MNKPTRLNKIVIFITLSLSCHAAVAGGKHIKDIDASNTLGTKPKSSAPHPGLP